MEDWKQELEEILEDETDTGKNMIPKYARCYARIILENFIEQEIEKAREEGREEIRQLLRDKKQVQEFLKENPKFYKGKKIETAGIATLTKF